MSFTLDDYQKFKEIALWTEAKQYIKDLGDAPNWTVEEIRAIVKDEGMIQAFFKNVKICNIPAKERNKTDYIPAFIQASANVAIYRNAYFFKVGSVWRVDRRSRKKVIYDVFGDVSLLAKFIDFLDCNDASQAKTFTTMNNNYIPAGNEFFDISNGCMVSEAPYDELRTYSIPAVDYQPLTLEECKSKLMKDLIKHIGLYKLGYLMQATADSMRGLHIADRRAFFIIGNSRTMKGTFGMVLKRLGLAPDVELTHDFSDGNDFEDGYSEVCSMYPVEFIDEAESINIRKVKKVSSDETSQCNRKGEPAITVINRGLLMFTSNRMPHSQIEGIHEKLAFVNTENIQYEKDNEYFNKLTAEDYNEFLCVLLTMCHEQALNGWKSSQMPPEVEQAHKEFLDENFPTDAFFMNWNHDAVDLDGNEIWTSSDNAYWQYLIYCNPEAVSEDIAKAVAESRAKPKKAPEGLVGISRQNFTGDAKIRLEEKWIKGIRHFRGAPPKHHFECEPELIDFA